MASSTEGFGYALDQMVPGLIAELEFLSHQWCHHWLDLVKANPSTSFTDSVMCDDIHESLVLQDVALDPAKPFLLLDFLLDYGLLAYKLHRDCILASVSTTMIKHFLLYEQAMIQFAFPLGSTLHGACIKHCAYLWIAHPPKIEA